jgi:hypothetical protein
MSAPPRPRQDEMGKLLSGEAAHRADQGVWTKSAKEGGYPAKDAGDKAEARHHRHGETKILGDPSGGLPRERRDHHGGPRHADGAGDPAETGDGHPDPGKSREGLGEGGRLRKGLEAGSATAFADGLPEGELCGPDEFTHLTDRLTHKRQVSHGLAGRFEKPPADAAEKLTEF